MGGWRPIKTLDAYLQTTRPYNYHIFRLDKWGIPHVARAKDPISDYITHWMPIKYPEPPKKTCLAENDETGECAARFCSHLKHRDRKIAHLEEELDKKHKKLDECNTEISTLNRKVSERGNTIGRLGLQIRYAEAELKDLGCRGYTYPGGCVTLGEPEQKCPCDTCKHYCHPGDRCMVRPEVERVKKTQGHPMRLPRAKRLTQWLIKRLILAESCHTHQTARYDRL